MDADKRLSLSADRSGIRLDLFVCQSSEGLSRSFVQKLIEDGHVTINGELGKPSRKVKIGDAIVVNLPPPEPSPDLVPEEVPLAILYEDGDILVVNKPAGLTVYPAPGHPRHTLMNAILAHCPEITRIESSVRPGVVHRLDKDTSGAMVVARNKVAQLNLASQIKGHRMLKKYLVLVKGCPSPEQGAIEAPISRHPKDRKRMAVVEGGRESRTLYKVTQALQWVLAGGGDAPDRAHPPDQGPLLAQTLAGGRRCCLWCEGGVAEQAVCTCLDAGLQASRQWGVR